MQLMYVELLEGPEGDVVCGKLPTGLYDCCPVRDRSLHEAVSTLCRRLSLVVHEEVRAVAPSQCGVEEQEKPLL